jgi:large subunit ribosomal protein L24
MAAVEVVKSTAKLKIKKGDTVQVISGADKGKTGKVLEVLTKDMKLLVEGVNVRKKSVKANQKNPQGGITTKEIPIHYSKCMLMDAKGKATRVGIKRVEKAGKVQLIRVAKSTGQEIASPAFSKKA